ncbi:thioredoxin family protein [Kaarinaea lacus]
MHISRLVIIFLLFVSATSASAAVGRDPYVHFFNETWNDFHEELAKAKEEGKKGIFLFFELDDCPWCHRMKATILNQPEVQEYYRKHFLNFSVDIEGDIEIVDFKGETYTQKEFAEKINRVRATPVMAFYDLEGNQVVRFTGAATHVEEFFWLAEYYLDEHYKKTNFTKFKRQKKKEAPQTQ